MAYPNITNVGTGQKPVGIKKVYIKNGAELWQTMGQIRNGSLTIVPNKTENTYKKNIHINSYLFEAKFEMLQTSVTAVELLPAILGGVAGVKNDFLFQLTDSASIPPTTPSATIGWVTVSASQVGVTAKYIVDGNTSTNQRIEITVKGTLFASAMDACVKASIADVQFTLAATGAQTFSGLGNYTLSALVGNAGKDVGVNADIKPNGFSSVALDDALSSGTDETLTFVRNGKITFDFVSEDDTLMRPNVYAVDVMVEYESTLTDDATLLLLDGLNVLNTQAIITLIDGKVFTFDQELGVEISFENIGDFDKLRALRFKHNGRILLSQFNGIVA